MTTDLSNYLNEFQYVYHSLGDFLGYTQSVGLRERCVL